MDYLSIAEARQRSGLRVMVLAEMPSPWSLAARAVLELKGLDYACAGQFIGQDKTELIDWTGQGSLPVVAYNDERLLTTPEGILFLAERLAPAPRLVPDDLEERALMFGLLREITGENGLGWYRRIEALGAAGDVDVSTGLAHTYGYRDDQLATAEKNVRDCLTMLTERLRRQQRSGSKYLVGDSLTAVDLYAAVFLAVMVNPVSNELIPLPDVFRELYDAPQPQVDDAFSPELQAYRKDVLTQYVQVPVDY